MNTNTHKFILDSTLSLVVISLSGNVLADAKLSQETADVRQETQIWTTYALSPYLRSNDLQVSVRNGKATLTGTVEDDVNKDLAKQIALGVNGIKDVDNKITVNADYKSQKSTSKERSYGQVIDDASITAAVKSKLLWGKNTSGLSAHVETQSGKVTLQGNADSGAAKELAGRIAKNTHGVTKVDNQLVVKNENNTKATESTKHSANDADDKISDSWITTKVKSTFIYSSNVNSSDISVSTQDGIVTLSGKLGSGAERELAIELAKNIRGVKSVQSSELVI